MEIKRENNIDLLKIVSCLMVISMHVSGYYAKTIIEGEPVFYFTVGNIFHNISVVCVPLFIMVSGNFMLGNNNNKIQKEYYIKIYKRIIKPTLYWNIFYVFYSLVRGIGLEKIMDYNINYLDIFKSFFRLNSYYHLWYMPMIISYLLIVPNLINLKEFIGEKKFKRLGLLLLILGSLIGNNILEIYGGDFIKYLGYFILGYSLKETIKSRKKVLLSAVSFIILSKIILFLNSQYIINGIVKFNWVTNYLSPLVIVNSIFLYIFFLNISIESKIIEKLSIKTFNIYFIHGAISEILYLVLKIILRERINPLIYIPIMIIWTLILSIIGIKFLDIIKCFFKNRELKIESAYN